MWSVGRLSLSLSFSLSLTHTHTHARTRALAQGGAGETAEEEGGIMSSVLGSGFWNMVGGGGDEQTAEKTKPKSEFLSDGPQRPEFDIVK